MPLKKLVKKKEKNAVLVENKEEKNGSNFMFTKGRHCMIFLSKSGHKESDEYNHFWRCSIGERSAGNIRKSLKLKQSV